jgi:FkbM family methyltransferase
MKSLLEPLRKAFVYPGKLVATFAPLQLVGFVTAYAFNRSPILIRTRGFPEPVWLRPRSTDVRVVYELFTRGELRMAWPLADQPRTIIDGGANVGYASQAFKQRWPAAHVLAVEPDGDNFVMLERNCASLKDVDRLQCGIWGSACSLRVSEGSDHSAWGLQFEPVPAGTSGGIAALPMAALIDRLPGGHCDLLKLDIEGAETDVFSQGDLDWIGRVSVILIETHGDLARETVMNVAHAWGFEIAPVGEKIMLWRERR